MKNLKERIAVLPAGAVMLCPKTGEICAKARGKSVDCASFNPDTNECVHVEVAMAQVRMVEIMEAKERKSLEVEERLIEQLNAYNKACIDAADRMARVRVLKGGSDNAE